MFFRTCDRKGFARLLGALLLLAPLAAAAQSTEVRGKVTSAEDGLPLIGVNVIEQGTYNGTSTNIDGGYIIKVSSADAQLEFSMIGMRTVTEKVGQRTSIDVVLKAESNLLGEVVVTGYSVQRKADLTGAVSVVDVDEMMKAAENNPMKALQGRIPGVEISANGSPSGAATVRIRGVGTLNNNDPLYIIDGIPTKAGMHELNSSDIESIQVLKDASSASIYGSRAANGVIIVTTKRGKDGVLRVSADASITASFYHNKLDMLDAEGYGRAMWQAYVNSSSNPNGNTIGYLYDWEYDGRNRPLLLSQKLPAYLDTAHTMRTSDTDWFDEVSSTGIAQSYNLSLSNGTDKGHYYFSLGYYDNDGIIRYTDFDRFSARVNTDFKLWDGVVTIGENLTVNRTSETQAPDGILNTALQALPVIPVHTTDGEGWGGPTGSMNDRDNPLRVLHANRDNNYRFWRTFGNVWIDIKPVKGLTLRSNFGLDYTNYYKQDYTRKYQAGKLNNDLNAVSINQSHSTKWTWSNTANYHLSKDRHLFDALVGMEMFYQKDLSHTAYKEGFYVEDTSAMVPDLGVGKSLTSGGSSSYALMSFFGKLDYTFDNRYILSATVRYDGSSRFGKNNRYGVFPAFSAGWRISQEAFMASAREVISDLKLRYGWGQTGNQEISNTARYTTYVTDYGTGNPTWGTVHGTGYDILGNNSSVLNSGFKLTQLGNDDLKWETTTQHNVGLDFSLLDASLYGTVEYYLKDTKDILVQPPYLGAIGEGGSRWVNGASMRNQGMEFSLGYRRETKSGFSYEIAGNLSFNRNKVTKLPAEVENSYGGNGKGDNILGHPLGSFYGYVTDGLFQSEAEVAAHAEQTGAGVGRIRYRDLDGSGTIDEDDRTWIGSPYPDFTYGMNFNFGYKGFDLSIFLQGVCNAWVENALKYSTDFWAVQETGSNKGARLLGAWSPSNSSSTIPAVSLDNANDEGRMSTYFIENGSYLKLRNIQLGYSLPEHLVKKMHLAKLRIYVSGQNLFCIKSDSFTGIDPENPAYGYPIPVTVTGGIQLSF